LKAYVVFRQDADSAAGDGERAIGQLAVLKSPWNGAPGVAQTLHLVPVEAARIDEPCDEMRILWLELAVPVAGVLI
jgi:hypothetical protein